MTNLKTSHSPQPVGSRRPRYIVGGSVLFGAALAWGTPANAAAQQPTLSVEPLESGTNAVLQAVSPVDDDILWVSGHEGRILRSRDGGNAWEVVPSPARDSLQFRDVHAFSWQSATVLSAGDGAASRIYRTDDGGANWSGQFVMNDDRGFLDCLDFWGGLWAPAGASGACD